MKADELTSEVLLLHDRTKYLDRLIAQQAQEIKALREQLHAAEITTARAQEKLDGHIKQFEKWDARRWTTIGFFVAGLITLVANLILLFVKGK